MTTPANSFVEDILDNFTIDGETPGYSNTEDFSLPRSSFLMVLSKWVLRLACAVIIVVCPWANFKLIQFFHTHSYHKESSAKWYIVFKGICDIIYIFISVPIIFCLTLNIDIIHYNYLTCKFITYVHYLSDDLISMMLTLLCIDRMIRITCGCRLRQRFSLTVCIIAIILFAIVNIHHIIRLRHQNGFCHKSYLGVLDYDFDIYYSFLYTSISWGIILIASINLTVSVYCDRTRRIQLKQKQQQRDQQQKISKIFLNGGDPIGGDSDRVELIHSTGNYEKSERKFLNEYYFIDDWEDSTAVTIEQNNIDNRLAEQDNVDLQITVCVLITSAIFLVCNVPNFIVFITRFVYSSAFTSIGLVMVYIALFPLFIAHTISYFVFNHLAARLFSTNSS
jgi:hypothetical protein